MKESLHQQQLQYEVAPEINKSKCDVPKMRSSNNGNEQNTESFATMAKLPEARPTG